jgi:hypothetical protein
MRFKCEIDMSNAAFKESSLELCLIIGRIAEQYYGNGQTSGKCYDSNGNRVGQWEIVE